MNPQQPQKPKIRFKLSNLILLFVAVFLIYMIPWGETNSFHRLLIFLFFLCFFLRFANARKRKMREFAHKRQMEERAALQEAALADAQPTAPLPENAATETPAEPKHE